jgi:signal transduction histidine kinase
MVAHDLKTPLSAIKSYTDLVMESGKVNDKQARFLQRTQKAVQTMEWLVRDLLDISWIDSSQNLEADVVKLGHLAKGVMDAHEARAAERNITVSLTVEDNLPETIGDWKRLERVVENLLSNAIKYTPEGGQVDIYVEPRDGWLTVSIEDNGPGIPAEHLPHIFKRFYRVPGSREQAEGTGLGLSIVKAIVERHQGQVMVDSEVGQGSTFTVQLPIIELR